MSSQHFVLTGATSGVGLSLLKLLLQQKVRVTVLVRSPQKLTALKNKDEDNLLQIIECDLLNMDDINGLQQYFQNTTITGLIYSAGMGYFKSISDHSVQEITDTYNLNVVHFNLLFKVLQPYLATKATIVGIGSQASHITQAYAAHYGASKAAFNQLLNALRLEHPNYHVMVVNTGPIDTAFHQKADPSLTYAQKYQSIMLDADTLAKDIINGIIWKKTEINKPYWMNVLLKFYNLAPRTFERLLPKLFKNKQ